MRYFLLLALVFLIIPPAHAHSPYLIKVGTIKDPDGNPVILEKLYGDGIFSSDPVSFQIRSRNGAVLVSTPTSDHVAIFCPHIKFCWAFPYGIVSPFAIGMRLNHASIDWDSPAPEVSIKGPERDRYQKYLADKNQKRAYGFEYPEMRTNSQGLGFFPSWWSAIFSPLFIIINHIVQLGLAALLPLGFPLIYWLFFERFNPPGKISSILVQIAGCLLALGYLMFCFAALVVLGFTLGTPLVYLLATLIASPLVASRLKGLRQKPELQPS